MLQNHDTVTAELSTEIKRVFDMLQSEIGQSALTWHTITKSKHAGY